MTEEQQKEPCVGIRAEALRQAFAKSGLDVLVFDTVDSTNNEAKRRAADLSGGALIVANSQSAGRGRMGRSFFSPRDTGLYFSLLYPIKGDLQSAVSLTSAASVAVMRAIRRVTDKQTAIKWVNDLYLNGKKVCGILTEAMSCGDTRYLIIGIGINLSTVSFPDALVDKAGAIGGEIDKVALLCAIWEELSPYIRDCSNTAWLPDYREHSCVLGNYVEWDDGTARRLGKAVGINEKGELEICAQNGETVVLRTGEISLFLNF